MAVSKDANINVPVFDLSQICEGPTPKAQKIMQLLDEKMFIIEKFRGKDYEEKLVMTLIRNMLEGFEHKEFRDHPAMFKFKDDPNEEVKYLPFRHFIINTIFWTPMILLDPDNLDESFIVSSEEMSKLTPVFIKQYMDDKYTTVYNRFIPTKPNLPITEINGELNYIIGTTNFLFTRISAYFADFMGISSSIEIFYDLANRLPGVKELFYTRLDETLQPAEMEKIQNEKVNELINIINNDKDFNPIKPLLKPGAGLNVRQFGDMCVVIGMKPNQKGETIPKPINSNFLVDGLNDPVKYYIDAIPGRKAAIINNEFMGRTGHLLILIAICTASVRLSHTVSDCGSPNAIPIEIKSEQYLTRLNGRNYHEAGSRKFKMIDAKKDKHLVGETIYVRSPITCCARDGVCKKCYGDLYYTNIDNYATGVN